MNPDKINRVERSKKTAKETYDRLSRWYDQLASPFESRVRQAGLNKLDAKPKEDILEIGSGTGQSLKALTQSIDASGHIYGLDISEGMHHIAQAKLIQAGLADMLVDLITGDGVYLPFKPASFDAILISFTLELFDTPEIPVVLKECRRVMRKQARMCVISLKRDDPPSSIVRFYEYIQSKIPGLVDCRPIYVAQTIEVAGFEILDLSEFSIFGLPVVVVLCQ